MKQKKIEFYDKLSRDAKKLVREYFAVKRVNGIEGYIISEEDFINRYKETKAYKEMKSAYYHPVYIVDNCECCCKPFEIDVESRDDLNNHINNPPRLCLSCKNISFDISQIIAIGLGKNIF